MLVVRPAACIGTRFVDGLDHVARETVLGPVLLAVGLLVAFGFGVGQGAAFTSAERP